MCSSPVTVVTRSQNLKLSHNRSVTATYVSQATCPDNCPFRESGCYAEYGHVGMVTKRLNKTVETIPSAIARIEADMINDLDGSQPIRLHVVGDCKDRFSAMIVSKACDEYTAKQGMPAWGYTHARVPRSDWGEVSMLRSCQTLEQVKSAHKAGYAAALVVGRFKSDKRYSINHGKGIFGIPCPVQTGRCESCMQCKLCFNDKTLLKLNTAILFKAHGVKIKSIQEMLKKK